jgi:hypothetical protein
MNGGRMEMRHSPNSATALLAWELGGGLGHCVNLAPIASGLIARGHQVYFAARDVATAQQVLQNPAVKYLQSPGVIARPAHALRQPRSFAQVLGQVAFGDDRQLRAVVESWRNLMELVQPAVIVCEHAPTALLASRWMDARRVVVGYGFTLPPDVSPLPDLCPWMGRLPMDLARHDAELVDRANRLLAADKLPPLQRLTQLYTDVDDAFLLTFHELDHHLGHRQVRDGQSATENLGTWSLRGGAEPDWPQGDGPRVFAYLKSLLGVFQLESALAVLRELPAKTLALRAECGQARARSRVTFAADLPRAGGHVRRGRAMRPGHLERHDRHGHAMPAGRRSAGAGAAVLGTNRL